MSTIRRRFVLFADLRGSTGLYEREGDRDATSLVSRRLSQLCRIIPRHGGTLVKMLGDGLMAVFPQGMAALGCAIEMQELAGQALGGDAPLPDLVLPLQIAISVGEVVEWSGDCFGDVVNVAARMLTHAGDGETLITGEVHAALPWEGQTCFVPLESIHMKGRQAPVMVHVMRRETRDSSATLANPVSAGAVVRRLRLSFEDRELQFDPKDFPVSIGRSSQCKVPVENARVSRLHARFDLNGGVVELTDLSTNGTFVGFDGEEELVSLRRGFCSLHGTGSIGLGGTPDNRRASTLRFEVQVEHSGARQPLAGS